MYIYIFVSSIFISALIAKSCLPKKENIFENIQLEFPEIHYYKKIQLLSYFSEKNNFERLEKLLDTNNGIYDKTLKLIQNNDEINKHYIKTKKMYQYYFNFEYEPSILTEFELNNKKIKSSLGQLNFIRWVFENDYLLHLS